MIARSEASGDSAKFEWPLEGLFRDLRVRYGIKMALAGMLGLFGALVLRLEHPNWSVLTVVVMMNSQHVGAISIKVIETFRTRQEVLAHGGRLCSPADSSMHLAQVLRPRRSRLRSMLRPLSPRAFGHIYRSSSMFSVRLIRKALHYATASFTSELSVWLPAFAAFVGAPEPLRVSEADALQTAGPDWIYYSTRLRGASNTKAKGDICAYESRRTSRKTDRSDAKDFGKCLSTFHPNARRVLRSRSLARASRVEVRRFEAAVQLSRRASLPR
jgi:hypothetical protein